jgi:hypothetical protein
MYNLLKKTTILLLSLSSISLSAGNQSEHKRNPGYTTYFKDKLQKAKKKMIDLEERIISGSRKTKELKRLLSRTTAVFLLIKFLCAIASIVQNVLLFAIAIVVIVILFSGNNHFSIEKLMSFIRNLGSKVIQTEPALFKHKKEAGYGGIINMDEEWEKSAWFLEEQAFARTLKANSRARNRRKKEYRTP